MEGSHHFQNADEMARNPYTHINTFFNHFLKRYEVPDQAGLGSIDFYRNYGAALREALNQFISMHSRDRDELNRLFEAMQARIHEMHNQITSLMAFVKNGTAVIPETIYDYQEVLKDVVERISGVTKWLSPDKAGRELSNAQKFDHSIANLKRLFPGAMEYPDVQERIGILEQLKLKMLAKESQYRGCIQAIVSLRREYGAIQHRKYGYQSFSDMVKHKKEDLIFNFQNFDRVVLYAGKIILNETKKRSWSKLEKGCHESEVLIEGTLGEIIMRSSLEDLHFLMAATRLNLKEILLRGKLETEPNVKNPAMIFLKPCRITRAVVLAKKRFFKTRCNDLKNPHLIQELTLLKQIAKSMAHLALVKSGMKTIFGDAYDIMQGICKQYTTELKIPEKIQMRLLRSMLDDPRAVLNERYVAEHRGSMTFDVYIDRKNGLNGASQAETKCYPKGIEKIEPDKVNGISPSRLTISQLKSLLKSTGNLIDVFWGPYSDLWRTNLGIMHEAARGLLYAEMLDMLARNEWPKWKTRYEAVYSSGQTQINVHTPLDQVCDVFTKTFTALNDLKKIEVCLHIAVNKMIDYGVFRSPHRLAYAQFTWKFSGRNLIREILTKYGLSDLEIHFRDTPNDQIIRGIQRNQFDMGFLNKVPNVSRNYRLLIDLMARKITARQFRDSIDETSGEGIRMIRS